MSLFGALLGMGDMMGDDDPFFGPQMRQMQHMNSMMNSLFADPFGMFGGGGGGMMALEGPRHSRSLMPQMPTFNRLFSHMDGMGMRGMPSSSYTSSTVVMSSGPNGRPQVYSETNSTQLGPDGLKETRKTVEDSRTGQRKMAIGHHIGERAHLVERERNVYTGEEQEHQDYINIDEEEADDFNREYQQKAGRYLRGAGAGAGGRRAALQGAAPLAIEAAPAAPPAPDASHAPAAAPATAVTRRSERDGEPSARRPLRHASTSHTHSAPAASSASVRELYGGAHPQRARRHRHHHHQHHHQHHDPQHQQHQHQH